MRASVGVGVEGTQILYPSDRNPLSKSQSCLAAMTAPAKRRSNEAFAAKHFVSTFGRRISPLWWLEGIKICLAVLILA
jgi:hypothetical protein